MQDKDLWPLYPGNPKTNEEENKKALTSIMRPSDFTSLLLTFSSLTRLLRITAYIMRFIQKCRKPPTAVTNWLSKTELTKSLHFWIRLVQEQHFPGELKSLASNQQIDRKSQIINLNPFLDQDKLLRLGGRLKYSKLSFNEKYPFIIPKGCYLVTLLINYAHQQTLHGGVQLTMNFLRKRFWIIDCRNQIRYRIQKCVSCFRQKAAVRNN